jgi:hypothetical protein
VQCDNNNRSTTHGATTAPATPTRRNDHNCNTTRGTKTTTATHTWRNNHDRDHDTTQPDNSTCNATQHDNSNCNTECGVTMATATPTRHNNSARDTTCGTTTATTKLTGLTETCTEKLYVVAITLVVNKIAPPGHCNPRTSPRVRVRFSLSAQARASGLHNVFSHNVHVHWRASVVLVVALLITWHRFVIHFNKQPENIFSAECMLSTKNDFHAMVSVLAYKFHDRWKYATHFMQVLPIRL